MTPERIFMQHVKRERKRKNLSQEAAAAKAGMTRQQWRQVEALVNMPTLETICRMADALDLCVDVTPKLFDDYIQ